MSSDIQPAGNPKWMTVVGWIFSALPALALLASGVVTKFMKIKPEGAPDMGWHESSNLGLGIVEVGCAVLYLIPRTSVIGAILLTGYLGGAVATHVRIGDAFVFPILFGALIWLGLILRDERLRATLPWRGDPSVPATGGFVAAVGKISLTLAALIGVIGALIVAQPSELRITRSETIDAPPAKVFDQVKDFHKWDAWTPWMEDDPSATVTYEGASEGTGAVFKWSGNDKVGEGSMTITESKASDHIKIKLAITRPMQDPADVEFTFKADGAKTIVTWTMSGEHTLLSKAVCSFMSMEMMVGGKFEKGLKNLKSVVETGSKN